MEEMVALLRIPSHPFYTGLLDPGDSRDLPVSLPFDLGIHPRYATPRLVVTDDIRTVLRDALIRQEAWLPPR